MQPQAVETSLATVERGEDGLIRIRVRLGARLTVSGFAEILQARKALAQHGPAGVIATVPDDIDFDLAILSVDHYAGIDARAFTQAFAIVSQAELHQRLCAIYNGYFKPGFPIRIFADEAEARAWVMGHGPRTVAG